VDGQNPDTTIDALSRACSDIGFLYVRNHGVSRNLVVDLVEQAALFFSRPMDQKMRIVVNPRMRGYLPLDYRSYEGDATAGKSHQEGFWIGHERPISAESPLDGTNVWPDDPPGLKLAMLAYFAAIERLSRVLLRGFALALDLKPNFFEPIFTRPMSRLKLNHYPPQDEPERENEIGVVPHSDSGGFTILWQDANGGLEIQSKSGEWVGAPPIPDTYVINLGNIMQIWTNGRFSATPHRVINRGGKDRYSIPLFVNPNRDAVIEPLIGTRDPCFEPFKFGDYQRKSYRRSFPVANIA
jgi:isopenicillin N synthase-like dioxygenase